MVHSPITTILKDLAGELYLLRLRRDYAKADSLRDELHSLGLTITFNKSHVCVAIPHTLHAWTHDLDPQIPHKKKDSPAHDT